MKKIISLLVILAMLMAMAPAVFAADETLTASLVASELGLENGTAVEDQKVGAITFGFSDGGNEYGNCPKYYNSGAAIRFYNLNTFTVSADADYEILSITIEAAGNYIAADNAEITNATYDELGVSPLVLTPVDGTAPVSVQYTKTSGNFRIASVTVEYKSTAPVVVGPDGSFANPYVIDSLPMTISYTLDAGNIDDGISYLYTPAEDVVLELTDGDGYALVAEWFDGISMDNLWDTYIAGLNEGGAELTAGVTYLVNLYAFAEGDYTVTLDASPATGGVDPSTELVLGENILVLDTNVSISDEYIFTAAEDGILCLEVIKLICNSVAGSEEWPVDDGAFDPEVGGLKIYVNMEAMDGLYGEYPVAAGDEVSVIFTSEYGTRNNYGFEATVYLELVPAGEPAPGTAENPYFIDDLNYDTPAIEYSVNVPAGATVHLAGRIGGMILSMPAGDFTVTVDGVALTAVDGLYVYEIPASEGGPWGPPTMITITNNGAADAVCDMVVDYPVGSMENPAVASWFDSVGCWLMNTELAAGDLDGYTYCFTVDKAGVVYVEVSSDVAVVVNVESSSNAYMGSNWDGLPVIIYPVAAGDVVTVSIAADYDENWQLPAASVYCSAFIVDGTVDAPVPVKSEDSISFPVVTGGSLALVDSTRSAVWSEGGICISGSAIANAVVKVYASDGTLVGTYTDNNADGQIDINVSGGFYARPIIVIENYTENEWAPGYLFTMTSCEAFEQDEKVHVHELQHHDAIEPGCHMQGMKEYWYCPGCDCFFENEAATMQTAYNRLIIPALGGDVVHVEAVDPGCHFDGCIEHWYCLECKLVWQDEALTQLTNHKNVTIPALGGDVVHVEAKDSTCFEEGCIEHWYCEKCEQVWQDEALTQLTNHQRVKIGAEHKHLVHMEAVDPGCHFDGCIEHWYCTDCGLVWQDADLRQVTNHKNVTIPALGGEVVHVEAKDPTCTENGCIEHWYCEKCEQVWQNAELNQLTNHKNVILGATGHQYGEDGVCTVCGDNPKAGDTVIGIVAAAAVVSALAVVALPVAKKKFF